MGNHIYKGPKRLSCSSCKTPQPVIGVIEFLNSDPKQELPIKKPVANEKLRFTFFFKSLVRFSFKPHTFLSFFAGAYLDFQNEGNVGG